MSPADRLRLEHMLTAARDTLDSVSGRSRESLARDRMLLRSIERELEIIGEAANKVSGEFRVSHPEIPWADMIGMRNRLTHAYFDIDLDMVWETVKEDLPSLVDRLDEVLAT